MTDGPDHPYGDSHTGMLCGAMVMRDGYGDVCGLPAAAHQPSRYDQCDDTCTADCGHCKGLGRPERRYELGTLSERLLADQRRTWDARHGPGASDD